MRQGVQRHTMVESCLHIKLLPETHTKRQATQLARRWGQLNWNSVRWGKKYFVLGRLVQPRQDKNLLYRQDNSNEPTKEGPLSFVLFESPFTSVSTVSRGPPLSSLSMANKLILEVQIRHVFYTYFSAILSVVWVHYSVHYLWVYWKGLGHVIE